MNSILTNMSAMTAVANLDATQKSLNMVQNEISSGLAVASASDNAAYWSIAQNMTTENSNLSAVTSSLNLGTSVLGTATSALSSMTGILQKIQADLVSAQQPGTDLSSIGTDITALQSQLTSSVQSASFNGVNLLDGSSVATASGGTSATATGGSVGFVSSVTGTGSSTQVNYLDVDAKGTNFGTGTGSKFSIIVAANTSQGTTAATVDVNTFAVSSSTSSGDLANYIAAVGAALTNVNTASENVGASQKNISLQSTFISSLTDSITSGVGSLVDADMNEASTRLNALQTQQQLGVQALSVANQNSQLILKLFGG